MKMLIWVVWLFSRPDMTRFAYSFLVGLGGMAVGNILGFLASPYNRGEKTAFSEYAKAIATFVTGFLLSKLDTLLGMLADPATLEKNPIYGARALVFAVAAVTALISTYVFRMYWEGGENFRGEVPGSADS
ncbi:MAG TPA: hypothetical protein VNA69_09555 [Thermoanaerobaculia bacterium]|nr:hypothetical protein [Thermoanaerobaculia bacterium]